LIKIAGMPQPESNERKWILLLCLLAAIHTFIFCAAFPFFNNVDEKLHFDLAVKYSHGEIPRSFATPCREAVQFISVYGTSEYAWSLEMLADKKIPPPPWTLPMDQTAQNLLAYEALSMEKVKNTEASQPPLYYTLAAGWWRFGKIFGMDGGHLLYWLRFMNILVIIALIWLGHFAARMIFPGNLFLRLGVPALIAFIPQTAFYSIQNDVLSPVCFGLAFILLIKFINAENPAIRLGTILGLALAATFLTKISNLPLLAVAGIFIALKTWRLRKEGKIRAALPAVLSLVICTALPMMLWVVWCKINFGDFTGSKGKIQLLGWTHKPFVEWWHHPIFTPHGFWIFIRDLFATFWQGEILWYRQPLALPIIDLIYVALTFILIGVAAVNLLRKTKFIAVPQRAALWIGLASFIAVIAFSGFLSIIYDFHGCFYPSREHPYFTSGRLMLGALIPFMLLFVYGIDRALKKFGETAKFLALAAMILFMLVSEIAIDWPVFSSQYNWFHM
jgi:hypothetical protein